MSIFIYLLLTLSVLSFRLDFWRKDIDSKENIIEIIITFSYVLE